MRDKYRYSKIYTYRNTAKSPEVFSCPISCVGVRRKYDDKCRTDPVWLAYNRAYKTHYARYMKKKMTTAEFEQWSRRAVELREQAEAGSILFEAYRTEIKK